MFVVWQEDLAAIFDLNRIDLAVRLPMSVFIKSVFATEVRGHSALVFNNQPSDACGPRLQISLTPQESIY